MEGKDKLREVIVQEVIMKNQSKPDKDTRFMFNVKFLKDSKGNLEVSLDDIISICDEYSLGFIYYSYPEKCFEIKEIKRD